MKSDQLILSKMFKGIAIFTPGGDLIYAIDPSKQDQWHLHLCVALQEILGLPEPPHFLVPGYTATIDRWLDPRTKQLQTSAEIYRPVQHHQALLNSVFGTSNLVWQVAPWQEGACDPSVLETYRHQFSQLWEDHDLIVRLERRQGLLRPTFLEGLGSNSYAHQQDTQGKKISLDNAKIYANKQRRPTEEVDGESNFNKTEAFPNQRIEGEQAFMPSSSRKSPTKQGNCTLENSNSQHQETGENLRSEIETHSELKDFAKQDIDRCDDTEPDLVKGSSAQEPITVDSERIGETSPLKRAHGYVLRLFVSGNNATTEHTLKSLHQLLEHSLNYPYTLKVIDVFKHPEQAEANQISATPTLLRVWPEPVRRIVGNLHDLERVLQVLAAPSEVC
ncbi:MAG: circadian clock protein KaiB [Symploca sp. SIO3C6]|nr:circadian clock protein KaiB [Symploca sp. SIO3C6]